MKTILASTLLIFTFLGHSAYAGPQVDLLWSNDSARVLESHAALVATPVERPLNAVHWKWDRVDAQAVIRRAFPQGRAVITPIEVVRADGRDESEVSEVDLREAITPSPRPLLGDI
jgi:hypothetical protein